MTHPTKDTRVLPCVKCGHSTLNTTAHREQPLPRKHRSRNAAGVCRNCIRRGDEHQQRAPIVPRVVVLEDWHWLHETGELDETQPLVERVRQAAPRIGMTPAGLEKALERAGIRNPVQRELPRRNREHDCHECRKYASEVGMLEGDLRHTIRRAAAYPNSPRLQRNVDARRADLARAEASRDLHLEYDHADDMEVAA